MRRLWIGVAVLLVVAVAAGIPAVSRYRVRAAMRDAIDRNAPESLAAIDALVKSGADIRTVGTGGETVAMVAAYWNDARVLQEALERGVEPNAEDPNFGNTALISAMSAPSVEPTRILLRAGARVNHQTKSGDTALIYAVRNAQYDIIPLLLEAGAKVDLQNAKGETAFTLAASLQKSGPRPMRPDLTAQDFVRLLQGARTESTITP
jgi:ankyrin repeat protein